MNVNSAILRRKMGLSRRIEIDFAIDRIRLKATTRLSPVPEPNEDLKTYGPLACSKLNNGIIAIANEDGYINLLNTKTTEDIANWLGHQNAIFDIKASMDKQSVLTASGDLTIRQWDVETKKEMLCLTAHASSIKSISIYDDRTIASGSRDGSIKIHDLRQKSPGIIIRDAHRNYSIGKSRKSLAKTDPVSCVTNVVFDPNFPRLYSTGANDATIKLWDLRGRTSTNRPRRLLNGQLVINEPYLQVYHPTRGVHCGYSHLILSSGKIFAACSDNRIYCYNNFGSGDEPIKFTGYQYDTYLKLAVIDDRFLVSGAKRGGALVWSLGNKNTSKYYPGTTRDPVGQLKTDDNDRFDTNVVETDWDSLSILTFRDDRFVCKWTMQHVLESEKKKLVENAALPSLENDVTIQMSDILDVSVLRPNHRVNNVLTNLG